MIDGALYLSASSTKLLYSGAIALLYDAEANRGGRAAFHLRCC